MFGFTLCADFSIFPDNHQLGPNFIFAAFNFSQNGGDLMFVNHTNNELGLQLPEEGVEITLPQVTNSLTLRLGTFMGEVQIEALDTDGDILVQRNVPELNRYIGMRLMAPSEISMLRITGGGNECILANICITICNR